MMLALRSFHCDIGEKWTHPGRDPWEHFRTSMAESIQRVSGVAYVSYTMSRYSEYGLIFNSVRSKLKITFGIPFEKKEWAWTNAKVKEKLQEKFL